MFTKINEKYVDSFKIFLAKEIHMRILCICKTQELRELVLQYQKVGDRDKIEEESLFKLQNKLNFEKNVDEFISDLISIKNEFLQACDSFNEFKNLKETEKKNDF